MIELNLINDFIIISELMTSMSKFNIVISLNYNLECFSSCVLIDIGIATPNNNNKKMSLLDLWTTGCALNDRNHLCYA